MLANRKVIDIVAAAVTIAITVAKKSKDLSAGVREIRTRIKKALMKLEDVDALIDRLEKSRERAADVLGVHKFKSKEDKRTSNLDATEN
jgi:hypothetical protein